MYLSSDLRAVLFFAMITSPVVLFIIAIHIFIVRRMTKKERQEIRLPQNKNFWIQCKKAALGFKIATVLFGAAHYLFLLPIVNDDDFGAAVIFFEIFALSTIIFASSLSSIYCYNFLFFVNREKATQILLVPVTLAILIDALFSVLYAIALNIDNILSLIIIIPCTIIFCIIIMGVLLSKKRKRFYAKQRETSPEDYHDGI